MKRFVKEFLISSAFIWILLFISYRTGMFISLNDEEYTGELVFVLIIIFPIVISIIVASLIYIFCIFRKHEKRFQKTFLYFFLSWSVFFLIEIAVPPATLWLQNQVYFGIHSEETKQELVKKAEKSLEKKMNKKYELISSEYSDGGHFGDMLFHLEFKEEGDKKDFRTTTVYLSHKKQGWRLKILNGDIWYMDK